MRIPQDSTGCSQDKTATHKHSASSRGSRYALHPMHPLHPTHPVHRSEGSRRGIFGKHTIALIHTHIRQRYHCTHTDTPRKRKTEIPQVPGGAASPRFSLNFRMRLPCMDREANMCVDREANMCVDREAQKDMRAVPEKAALACQ